MTYKSNHSMTPGAVLENDAFIFQVGDDGFTHEQAACKIYPHLKGQGSYTTRSGVMVYGNNAGYDFFPVEASSDPVRYTFFKVDPAGPYESFDLGKAKKGWAECIYTTHDGFVIEGQKLAGSTCPATTQELVALAVESGYVITNRHQIKPS